MSLLQVLWIIIYGNISVAAFNIISTMLMRYENWSYKLFGSKTMYIIYGAIYTGWFAIGLNFNLVP